MRGGGHAGKRDKPCYKRRSSHTACARQAAARRSRMLALRQFRQELLGASAALKGLVLDTRAQKQD